MNEEYVSKYLTGQDIDNTLDKATTAVQPEDLDELKEDLIESKDELNALTAVNTELVDGYISSTNGNLSPPTANKEKSTDFIYVKNCSIIKSVIKYSTAKYKLFAVTGYDKEKRFISQFYKDEGGQVSEINASVDIPNNVVYIRISFNGHELFTSADFYARTNIYSSLSDVNTSISELSERELQSKNAIDALNENMDKLTEISVELIDGFIDKNNGRLNPATTNKEKSTDYIDVKNCSTINSIIRYSEEVYRQFTVNGYDINKNYISQFYKEEGGRTTKIESTVEIPDNVAYIRMSFVGKDAIESTYFFGATSIYNSITTIDNRITESNKDLNDKIEEVKKDVGIKFQYINSELWELGYYNVSSSTGTIRKNSSDSWHCIKISDIPKGTYNYNKIGTLTFCFIENAKTGEYLKAADAGIIDTLNGTIEIEYDFNLYLSANSTNITSKAMFANGILPSEYVYGEYKEKTDSYYVNEQGQTVWIVGKGYIPTIQGACDIAKENDIIFVRCGTYTEQVSIWNKKLHIIGENKVNTILIDHSGNYDTPPIEMSLGSLSNMTIIEDGTEPTGEGVAGKYMYAYCLHIEWQPHTPNEVFRIDNCDFINYIHSPLGCGLYQDYTVHFTNCSFICKAEHEEGKERGSFYFHSNIHPNITNQNIIAENCIISSTGDKWAVLMGVPNGADNTGEAFARFSNCCVWNESLGTADSIIHYDYSGGADVLKLKNSFGNTVDALNSNL